MTTGHQISFREIRNYFLVSCFGLCVDATLLLLGRLAHLPYELAGALSFMAGSVAGYYLCRRFVFAPQGHGTAYGLTLFLVLGIVGVAVNALVLGIVVEWLHQPLWLAKVFAAASTFVVNYVMRKRYVFARGRPQRVLVMAEEPL